MFIRAYLRASTDAQNANRARHMLDEFAASRNQCIAAYYVENESGAWLTRPELFRLLADSRPGDVLLTEQVDRLSRLNTEDWERLKDLLKSKKVRVVALDLPTSWTGIAPTDELTARILDAMNAMLLDMLAAIARKDYVDRRVRQAQGIAAAKEQGKFKGRRENTARNATVETLLRNKVSWSGVMAVTEVSRSTVSKIARRIKAADEARAAAGNPASSSKPGATPTEAPDRPASKGPSSPVSPRPSPRTTSNTVRTASTRQPRRNRLQASAD